ncbi:MAG: MoxR family ATPase [Candidatus Micrarchaeia archaeon]
MKINEFKETVKLMVKHKVKAPLIAFGHAGIGKTQTLLDIGEELQIPVSILRIGSKNDVGDLLGMMTLNQMKTGSVYAPPAWFRILQEAGKGILFLDEVNRGKPELNDAIMQLLDSRRLDEFVLPDDVVIIGAANPPTEEYDVNEFEKALYDRFVAVPVTIAIEDIVAYMTEREWDQRLIEHVLAGQEELDISKPVSLPKKTWTPRGERQLLQFLPVIDELTSEIARNDIVVGCVGVEGFSRWKNMELFKKIPTAEQYLNHPEKYNIEKYNVQEQRILVMRLVAHLTKKHVTEKEKTLFSKTLSKCSDAIIAFVFRLASRDDIKVAKIINLLDQDLTKKAEEIISILNK